MKLRYLFFVSLLGLLLCTSCSRKATLQKAYQLEDRADNRSNNPKNGVNVTTAFIGDAINFITFQVDVENKSDSSITIDASNIALLIDLGDTRRQYAQPVHKADIINYLSREAGLLESERKSANTVTAVLGGLDVVASVLSGAGAAETVIRGGDYAVEAVDRSQRYKLVQQSVEEQLAYHEEFSLDRATIPPGAKATYDIHFEPPMVNAYGELEITWANHTYDFHYKLEVIEERLR